MVHQAGAYPGFLSMKRLGVFLLPLDGMLVHRRVTPSSKFTGTHLYSRVKRGTVSVKCLAQENNAVSRTGLKPGPLDPESSALSIRLPKCQTSPVDLNRTGICSRVRNSMTLINERGRGRDVKICIHSADRWFS